MMRWDRVAATLAALALIAATAQVAIAVRAAPESLLEKLIAIAVTTPAIVLGVIVSRRIPTNPVGAVLTLVGAAPLIDLALEVWGSTAGTARAVPGAEIVAIVAESTWMMHYIGPILLAFIFPTGRLLTPRWRWAVVALVAVPVGFAVSIAFVPQELGFLVIPFPVALLGVLISAVVAVVLRYRRGGEQLRRQLRWLMVSAILLPLILVVCWFELILFGSTNAVGIALAVLVVALPVSVAIAMLRHSLWGYDRLLAGTVRWVLIVAGVATVFATLVLVLGLVFGQYSPIAVAVATLAATLLARPLHGAIRRWVDARFQPVRTRMLAAVGSFVADVRDGRAAPEDLQGVIDGAAGGGGAGIIVDTDEARLVAEPGAHVTPADLHALENEARLPLELGRLRRDLREALVQTDASRARLVAAADDERRRIQRDLHDGAQSNLVALGMRLRTLQRASAPDVATELAEAVELVQRTITDLRSMAQGVRPSSLDEGLEPALRAMVKSVPLPVDLHLDSVAVPEPRATAAYYLAAEAVTNALKHAKPSRIGITLRRDDGGVRLGVHDDGSGGAVDAIGFGLAGVRDRIEAAGGRLLVSSPAGVGTLIEAVFP